MAGAVSRIRRSSEPVRRRLHKGEYRRSTMRIYSYVIRHTALPTAIHTYLFHIPDSPVNTILNCRLPTLPLPAFPPTVTSINATLPLCNTYASTAHSYLPTELTSSITSCNLSRNPRQERVPESGPSLLLTLLLGLHHHAHNCVEPGAVRHVAGEVGERVILAASWLLSFAHVRGLLTECQ